MNLFFVLSLYFCSRYWDSSKLIINKKLKLVMAHKISDECIACGTCIEECPVDAISEGEIFIIDGELCTDCGSCVDVCPTDAISPE